MKDRIPQPGKEGRIRIESDDGEVLIEGILKHADDAAQEGSDYKVANVLPAVTCDYLRIDKVTSEPKDAWLACMTNPIIGDAAPTADTPGSLGQFYSYMSELGVVQIYQCVYSNAKLGVYCWKLVSQSTVYKKVTEEITTSGSWTAPKNMVRELDMTVTAIGGGGGGGAGGAGGWGGDNYKISSSSWYAGAPGGGGGGGAGGYSGQTVSKTFRFTKNNYLHITIGKGGKGGVGGSNSGAAGEDGGETKFGTILTADGGAGGAGGAKGDYGTDGTSSGKGTAGIGGAGGQSGYAVGTKGANGSTTTGGTGGTGGRSETVDGGAGGARDSENNGKRGGNGKAGATVGSGGSGGGGGGGGGVDSSFYDGAGGGGGVGGNGGNGADGKIVLEYYVVDVA